MTDEQERRAAALKRIEAREELEFRKAYERARKDEMFWLRHCTQTYDDQAVANGLPVYRPFKATPYLDLVMEYFKDQDEEAILVPKSREMMTSWLAMGYAAHLCQFSERAFVVLQTQKEDKGQKLISYAKCLYDRQSLRFRQKHPLKRGALQSDDLSQSKNSLVWQTGAEILAVPSGSDQIRSHHPTVVILDEAAHLAEAGESYDAARPATRKIIVISSAGPGWFAECCDEEVMV